MSLSTSIVDIDSIHINLSSATFNTQDKKVEIEALAHTIVDLKGICRIPVVRMIGIDEYELVSGYLEYFAFLKARELDSSLVDRLTVFILKPKNEEAILKQIEVSQAVDQIEKKETHKSSEHETLLLKFNNLEAQFDLLAKNLSANISQLNVDVLATIDKKLPQPLPLLEAFNRILEPSVQEKIARKFIALGKGKKKVNEIIEVLKDHRRKTNSDFKSFKDVKNACGKGFLSDSKFLEMIDDWSK